MSLDFICSCEIINNEQINIPKSANCYKLSSGNILFFKTNPEARFCKIPLYASSISFDMQKHKFNINYGKPVYRYSNGYDLQEDKVLK
ncbi:MAG: hypothetical protein ACP5OG_03075 [Candidatus Nanoarchaeia archaeon]